MVVTLLVVPELALVDAVVGVVAVELVLAVVVTELVLAVGAAVVEA